VVALLAVLKAGAAYVPLDPHYPAERLAFVARDTGLRVAVGEASGPCAGLGLTVVETGGEPADPDGGLPRIGADAAAYVIHTSGSTGRPKGVVVGHRHVAALLGATAQGFGLGPGDVWTFFHSFAFDFSVWEIWGCLLTGGRLVVVPFTVSRDPEEFHALLVREEVTVVNQTPSAFSQLVGAQAFGAGGLAVRLLVFGGEPLDPGMLLPWFDRYPPSRCRAVNMYGITETTVHCTWHTVTRADALTGSRSVGRPLPGWDLHVLDDRGRPAPPGVPGEIHVGGAGVSFGYLGRPELTAERFIPDHLTGEPGSRLYRTGDLGRYRPDGQLEHLGRLDDQVKIRGHRIELGEIRGFLLEEPAVIGAAALVHGAGDAALARVDAYIVAEPGTDTREIMRRLADRLPDYLLPATLTVVAELPLTPNGKLDADRLPSPVVGTERARGTAFPSQDAGATPDRAARDEATLDRAVGNEATPDRAARDEPHVTRMAEVWQSVMGVAVGPDDNFCDLGGTSLLAVRLNAALRKDGFPAVQLRDIFRNSTPRRLAAAIASRTAADAVEPHRVESRQP
jgi:amino acid adenylation domain-containing protein